MTLVANLEKGAGIQMGLRPSVFCLAERWLREHPPSKLKRRAALLRIQGVGMIETRETSLCVAVPGDELRFHC